MREAARRWYATHSYDHRQITAEQVAQALADQRLRAAVVIPARNEEATVGQVVTTIREALVDRVPVVADLVVIDSDSRDATAVVAADAGARVVASASIAPDEGSHPGKGEALWKSLFATDTDLLVFVDADLTHWGPHFVTGLLHPLLDRPDVHLVKGWYDRILTRDGYPATPEGGRVTELVARPVLDLWWPDLAAVVQPLAGEWAVRRAFFESVSVPTGYGVEIAALVDAYTTHGLDGIAQVDLGARAHRHQKDHDLAVMAAEILAVAHSRCVGGPPPSRLPVSPCVQQPVRDEQRRTVWRERPIPVTQRPPATTVDSDAR